MVMPGLINLDFADVRTVMTRDGQGDDGHRRGERRKRALRAAEAAISNPLIDDVSMKGAKAVLIYITGGKDLTLYEVDEAATRIREEVDSEANIIFGATFDETLEGVIRVSVVATGVDMVAAARPLTEVQQKAAVANHEARIKELTRQLRVDTQQMQERTERIEPRTQPAAPTPAETAATAAVKAALEEVTIKPMAPKPTMLEPMPAKPAVAQVDPPMPKVFIPPQPERPVARGPRIPSLDEFPAHAQNVVRAQQAQAVEPEAVEKPRSLLARLAAVGLGRREESHEPPAERASSRQQMPPLAERPAPRPIPTRLPDARQERPERQDPVSEYARRSTPQGLDQHGRPLPAVHNPGNPSDDDQLEIPAFLRRQAQ